MTMSWLFVSLFSNLLLVTLLVANMHFQEQDEHLQFVKRLDKLFSSSRLPTPKEQRDARVAWGLSNDNFNFNKALQWNLTYYTLLLFGAVVALALRLVASPFIRILLFAVANAAFDVSFYIAWYNQHQIRRERLSVIGSEMKLTTDPQDTMRFEKQIRKAESLLTHPAIIFTVMGTIIVGYVVSLYVVLVWPQ